MLFFPAPLGASCAAVPGVPPGRMADFVFQAPGGLHAFRLFRGSGRQLVVFFPALRSATARRRPFYARLSWDLGPGISRLYVADPLDAADAADPRCRGSWFQGLRGQDGFETTAACLRGICAAQGLDLGQSVLYGSSMGGFAALAVAACLPGPRVLAEAPQTSLDVPRPASVAERQAMLRACYGLERFEDLPPGLRWRIRLSEIFARNRIPRGLILCRKSDRYHGQAARTLLAGLPLLSGLRLRHHADADGLRGHAALPRETICDRLRQSLAAAAWDEPG